jgi:hypothetical protein
MRSALTGLAGVLVLVAIPAAALGVWMLASGGYEPDARHFVGSLFLAGAAVALLTAIAMGRAGRRR